jgi:hypothetical protein
MENSLTITMEASLSLNFLIYIQNIFLNKTRSKSDLKFPYMPAECQLREDFDVRFRDLWNDISERIADDPSQDQLILIEERNLFYQTLFTENDDSLSEFDQIYTSFRAWWRSLAGGFAVEICMGETLDKIYRGLADLLIEKGIKPRKRLYLNLIYDQCLLAVAEPSSYYATLSLEDGFMRYKEIPGRLLHSID